MGSGAVFGCSPTGSPVKASAPSPSPPAAPSPPSALLPPPVEELIIRMGCAVNAEACSTPIL